MKKNILLLLIASMVISSCVNITLPSVAVETNEALVLAVHTAAAQTIIASLPTNTNTPRPTFTDAPTETPFPSLTPNQSVIMTQSVPSTSTLSPVEYCENIQFWADVEIDSGQQIFSDISFTKTWSFKNIGTCNIGSGYILTYYGGDDFGDHKGKLKTTTSPGEIGQVSVAMKAPHKHGTYTAHYMFVNPKGFFFGPTFTVRITVPKPTNTPTPLPTSTTDPDEDPTLTPSETAVP